MISEEKVRAVFVLLKTAREEAYEAAKSETRAKQKLRNAEHVALIRGEIDGKNEKHREGQLAILTDAETLAHREAQESRVFAEMILELAKDRVRCLEIMVGLMKLEKGA